MAEPMSDDGERRPTLETAWTALHGLYGPHTADVWRTLLFSAGLSGGETDVTSFNRLIDCMKVGDPITRICGLSLSVRFAAFARIGQPG
jgi:hypothetical protein